MRHGRCDHRQKRGKGYALAFGHGVSTPRVCALLAFGLYVRSPGSAAYFGLRQDGWVDCFSV
jgi:hypothetical protein